MGGGGRRRVRAYLNIYPKKYCHSMLSRFVFTPPPPPIHVWSGCVLPFSISYQFCNLNLYILVYIKYCSEVALRHTLPGCATSVYTYWYIYKILQWSSSKAYTPRVCNLSLYILVYIKYCSEVDLRHTLPGCATSIYTYWYI